MEKGTAEAVPFTIACTAYLASGLKFSDAELMQ